MERAWCERGKQIREVLCIVCPDSFSLLFSLWVRNHASANRVKERARTDAVMGTYVGISVSDRQRDGDRVKEVLASWSTSKRTRGACIYFWRYRVFDVGEEGDGSILGIMVCLILRTV